jgi:hypothetical protein
MAVSVLSAKVEDQISRLQDRIYYATSDGNLEAQMPWIELESYLNDILRSIISLYGPSIQAYTSELVPFGVRNQLLKRCGVDTSTTSTVLRE